VIFLNFLSGLVLTVLSDEFYKAITDEGGGAASD